MKAKQFLTQLPLKCLVMTILPVALLIHETSQAEEIRYPLPSYSEKELEKVREWEKKWAGEKIDHTNIDKVKEFASNYPQNDDITLVVIKVL